MDADQIAALLRGKVFLGMTVNAGGRVCIEFSDDSQLLMNADGGMELRLSEHHHDAPVANARFSYGLPGELDDGTAQWVSNPSEDDVRSTIIMAEVVHGEEFRLQHNSGLLLVAVALEGPLRPEAPGRFILYENERQVGGPNKTFTRLEVLSRFLRGLSEMYQAGKE